MAGRDIYTTSFDEDAQQNRHNTCPECGGRVTMNRKETVCDDCGLVIADQRIDTGPEWRSFDGDEAERTRIGAPLTPARHDRGLSTTIGKLRDGNGNYLSHATQRRLDRLRREQRRARQQSKRDRNQMYGLMEIRRLAEQLGCDTTLRDQACQLFRTAQREDREEALRERFQSVTD